METTLNRRSFIAGTAAFGAVGIGRAERPQHDFDAIQKEIEALPKDVFMDFTQGVNLSEDKSTIPAADCEAMYARYPILRRYDEAFREVVNEVRRSFSQRGIEPPLWYYRDRDGKEIDLVLERDGALQPVEIRKSAAPRREMAAAFRMLDPAPQPRGTGAIVCMAGEAGAVSSDVLVLPAWAI